jgi:hypothetical protein
MRTTTPKAISTFTPLVQATPAQMDHDRSAARAT